MLRGALVGPLSHRYGIAAEMLPVDDELSPSDVERLLDCLVAVIDGDN